MDHDLRRVRVSLTAPGPPPPNAHGASGRDPLRRPGGRTRRRAPAEGCSTTLDDMLDRHWAARTWAPRPTPRSPADNATSATNARRRGHPLTTPRTRNCRHADQRTDLADCTASEFAPHAAAGRRHQSRRCRPINTRHIEQLNPALGAYCLVAPDRSLDAAPAGALDNERSVRRNSTACRCRSKDHRPHGRPTLRNSRTVDRQYLGRRRAGHARLREPAPVLLGKTATPVRLQGREPIRR